MEIILIITVVCVLFIILLSVRKANLDVERRLTDVITRELKEIRGNVDISSRDMTEQVSSFIRETTNIKEKMNTLQGTVKDITSFQEFFRSPKIRGQWGEANLKHLLHEYFPEELFAIQHKFSSGEVVDAVLKLPDKKLLPIDSKFPFDNFRKMIETEGDERDIFRKKFLEDVKKRIKEISEKYILPSEDTVDFGVMYIPAEAVYYEINMASDLDIAEFARSKKVILSSPNTFYLTLRSVEQWFRDTQITRQAQDIMKRLTKIEKDGNKLTDDFRKLGIHLKNAASAYKSSRKRVALFDKKVKSILKSNNKRLTGPEK
jgi:DNA recombination protein RmuC